MQQQIKRRFDFIIIYSPWALILRPVTDEARDFIHMAYASSPKAHGDSLVFEATDEAAQHFNDAIDGLTACGLSVTVL